MQLSAVKVTGAWPQKDQGALHVFSNHALRSGPAKGTSQYTLMSLSEKKKKTPARAVYHNVTLEINLLEEVFYNNMSPDVFEFTSLQCESVEFLLSAN